MIITLTKTQPAEKIAELIKKVMDKGVAFIRDGELLSDLIKFSRGIDTIEDELMERLFHGTCDRGYELKVPSDEGSIEIRIYWNDNQTSLLQYQDGYYIPDWAICYSKPKSPVCDRND